MAVSHLSSFFSTLLPSKSSSCLRLPQYSSSSLSVCVVYPALAYSNTLYFKSAYNVQVIVSENEPEDRLLNRFRKEVLKAGVIQECKRRRFFENQHDKKKRKAREAARKNRKRRPQSRAPIQNKDEASNKRKDDEGGKDNWELPDVDLPYC